MTPVAERFQKALTATSRADVLAALRPRRATALGPLEINRLVAHLRQLGEPPVAVKLVLLRTYTTDLLKTYWPLEGLLNGLDISVYEAPYGVIHEEGGAGTEDAKPDMACFFLRAEDLHPALRDPVSALSDEARATVVDEAVAQLDNILSSFRRASPLALGVVTLLPPMHGPELGQFDAMAGESSGDLRSQLKRRIAKNLREKHAAVLFDDLDELAAEVGRATLFDPRLWFSSRFPWSVAGAQALVRRLVRYATVLKYPRAKVIVLDADNTLWGGIVGEDGPDGIALGPEYPGSAFVAFQRRLLDFQQRGILLAMCSKNNPDDVAEVLRDHPHQLLRESHFAAMRVNWEPKIDNLKSLAKELNLGLDSFVCVDDSPHECFQVKQQLPQVTVVAAPQQPVEIPWTLDDIPSLEILSLTHEDRERTAMYVQERQRKQLATRSTDYGQYLGSLEMEMTVSLDDRRHLQRIVQLTQKTNQFNLTTRRYLETDIERMIEHPDWLVADFSLTDVFGDSGIVGVALVNGLRGTTAEVDTLLMSCRVIGRGAETAFLQTILDECAQRGVQRIRAQYLPTRMNGLVKDYWPRHEFAESDGWFHADLPHRAFSEASAIRVTVVRPTSGGSRAAARASVSSS
jgi:HAD-superfamily phosphatase, subfamily IIIC/FkbH-like domain